MFVLLLAGDLNERLLGFPELLLELVDHRGVLALDEAVQVVPGVATAMIQRFFFLQRISVATVVSSRDLSKKTQTKMVRSMKARFELTNVLRPCFRMNCGEKRMQLTGQMKLRGKLQYSVFLFFCPVVQYNSVSHRRPVLKALIFSPPKPSVSIRFT